MVFIITTASDFSQNFGILFYNNFWLHRSEILNLTRVRILSDEKEKREIRKELLSVCKGMNVVQDHRGYDGFRGNWDSDVYYKSHCVYTCQSGIVAQGDEG